MRKLNAIVSTEAVLAMGMMVYSAIQGAVPVFSGITIHWPVWLFMSGLGLGALVSFNWPWIRRLRPANRFHDLTPDIKAAHASFIKNDISYVGESPSLTGTTKAEILVVMHKLESLHVPCPPLDVDELRTWLPVIQSMAETKRLADAKAITQPPLSADADPAQGSASISQPTATIERASRYMRIKDWLKKL